MSNENKMAKKPFKIVKSKLFKKQEKKLSNKDRKMINNALKELSVNPLGAKNTMGLFNPPSPAELKNWMSETKAEIIDQVFEYLHDKKCLNKKGEKLAKDFWSKYIKKK